MLYFATVYFYVLFCLINYFQVQVQVQVLRSRVVRLMCDNAVTVAYIKNEGGTRSLTLMQMTIRLLKWCDSKAITLVPVHLPGVHNIQADSLSRVSQTLTTEWKMAMASLRPVFAKWGKPQIDLFATFANRQLVKFVSPYPDPRAEWTDAMSMPWDKERVLLYTFPPFKMVPQVLQKIAQSAFCRTKRWHVFRVRSHHFSTYMMHLFRDGLLSSTIISHRMSVASVLRHWVYDPAADPHIQLLVRAFRLECPVQCRIMPKWDLHLVLLSLLRPPFTSQSEEDGKFLGWRHSPKMADAECVFLLALASARRRSYLHALSIAPDWCVFARGNTQRQLVVSLLPEP